MEPFLVAGIFLSLAFAALMSVVAWKLLREKHDRSAARVEALEAMAFAETAPAAAAETPPAAAAAHVMVTTRHVRRDRDVLADADEAFEVSDFDRADAIAASRDDFDRDPLPAFADDEDERSDGSRPAEKSWDLALRRDEMRADTRRGTRRHGGRDSAPAVDVLFEPTSATGASGRRWLALAAVVLVAGAGVATMYALQTPELVAAIVAPRPSRPARPAPLELLSLRHAIDDNGTLTVTGLTQNPKNGAPLAGVTAVLYLFDDKGQYFAGGRGTLKQGTVEPGEEAPFVITVPNANGVSRYRVGFRREDGGGVVEHVDHRGQLPSETTGDAMDERAPAGVSRIPRRLEG